MFRHLLNLVFPKICAGCKNILLQTEMVICSECRHELPITNHFANPNNDAYKKFYGRIDIEFGAALFYFHKKGIVPEIIYSLKYNGNQEVGTVLGNWAIEEFKSNGFVTNFDIVIPVPIHKKKLRKRGYNQVANFGIAVAKGLNIEYKEEILRRNVFLKSQSKKKLEDRNTVAENVFEAVNVTNFENKHFLLVDDVLTTGATLEACGRALLKIPGAKLSVLCIASASL
jgi:ComF family protein